MNKFNSQPIRPIRSTQGRPEEFEGRQAQGGKGLVPIVIVLIVLVLVGIIGGGVYVYQKSNIKDQKKEVIKKQNLFSSNKVFSGFQSALIEMCLEITPILELEHEFEFLEKATLQEKAESVCSMFVSQAENILLVSDIEAKKFLAGEYDDIKNKKEIEIYISELTNTRLKLPSFPKYFIQKYQQGKLFGSQLEIAVRILKSLINEIVKEIN